MSKTLNMVGGGAKGLFASIFATGVDQSDTVTLTTPSGKVKSGKWSSKPNPAAHGLPAEYQEVEYIEATGTQFFNTLFTPSTTDCFKLKLKITTPATVANGYFYGASSGNGWCSFEYLNTQAYWNVGNSTVKGGHAMSGGTAYEYDVTYKKGTFSVEGATSFSMSYSGNLGSEQFCVFNSGVGNSNFAKGKLKYLQMYAGSDFEIIRDYVPCYRKSDNAAGLYDLVNGVFYANAGTGEFVVGPEIPATFGGYLFEKLGEYGTYTLTAIRSTDGKTETVEILVDAAVEYLIEISFQLWLYNSGDQCEDVTAGWSAGWAYGGGGSISMNSDHFTVSASYGQNAKGCETNQRVSITGYSKLKAEVTPVNCNNGTTHPNELWLYAIDNRGTWGEINKCVKATHVNQSDAAYKNLPLGETAIIIYDITSLTGDKYVGLASYGGNTWKVNRVWLE